MPWPIRSGKDHPRYKHGHRKAVNGRPTPTLLSYEAMKQRCLNPNRENYHHYGGRGISVCARWLGPDGFTNFLSDMGERPHGTSIGRRDSNADYCPGNCRWEDKTSQARNQSHCVRITLDGETKVVAEWLRQYGVSRSAYECRVRRGWTHERAIKTKGDARRARSRKPTEQVSLADPAAFALR